MQMHAFSVCLDWLFPPPHALPCPQLQLLFPQAASSSISSIIPPSFSSLPTTRIINLRSLVARKPIAPSSQPFHANSSKIESTTLFGNNEDASDDVDVGGDDNREEDDSDLSGGMGLLSVDRSSGDDDIEIEIEEIRKNSRRIRSRIPIDASLQTVWNILTEYEKLADYIPGLAVSQVLERRGNFVRLFQIGQQNLAFGLIFNAKGTIDCYEKPLENLPSGHRREIEFKMIEGDFKLFEGKWSIEQYSIERCEDGDSSEGQESHTTLSYVVDVEPKLWLPVRLVEGRLCREITVNLSCIRVEAQKWVLSPKFFNFLLRKALSH
ncbi:uncharacterized protein LOC131302416 isoform X1 [Rhododendron vialii]|uniref:uncharacterized protein LOC131302416 isoform X1 n=1 Tax=Rhododendron vialii TaxID=182163 RepID=UPI00265E0066|nr:uncharacterized protein LOC131302416 isoform X1 [Rhododendron vialii]XP_058185015.1 uncharacterized protein LOC131302416 isoform X1 [Rhododendron vialii]XP_058185016.1 uncharacterized protein LOC131302416 isoform X1 [Rhododendron vialii]